MSSLKALAELTVELHKPLTLDEMMQLVVARAAELLGTERTSLRLLDAARTRLLAVCRHGRPVHAGRQEEFTVDVPRQGRRPEPRRGRRLTVAAAGTFC